MPQKERFLDMVAGVLDEEEGETLVNVNIVDDERAAKNVENKKKKPTYQPYDEDEFDEQGMVCICLKILQTSFEASLIPVILDISSVYSRFINYISYLPFAFKDSP
jgi:hypothetical protein